MIWQAYVKGGLYPSLGVPGKNLEKSLNMSKIQLLQSDQMEVTKKAMFNDHGYRSKRRSRLEAKNLENLSPLEKRSQIGSFPQIFGVNIPKVLELPVF